MLETFFGTLRKLERPGISMAIFSLAPLARVTTSSMLAVLGSNCMPHHAGKRARATHGSLPLRLPRRGCLPVITTLDRVVFSFLLGADMLVETMTPQPGVRLYAVNALVASEYAAGAGLRAGPIAVLYVRRWMP